MKWIVAFVFGLMLATPAMAEVRILVDLSEQVMVVETPNLNQPIVWDVSTARKGMVTPTGNYQPTWMTPMHRSKKYKNAPMPYSIFFKGGYAIHGTDAISKLGTRASHGCIRLHPDNARALYKLVSFYGKENTYIQIVP